MQAATKVRHVVAMPYPARGHINPLLILSKLLASKKNDILITIVLTEDFPPNIRFATISNDVIPSAQLQAADVHIFDRLDPPVTTIITDIILPFVIEAGCNRNIPVALFWAPSATTFTILYHAHLFDKGIPVNMEENGNDVVDFIPGISSIRVSDLPRIFPKNDQVLTLQRWPYEFPSSKVKFLRFGTVYELESQVCDVFKAKLEYPVYSVGPLIPYYELDCKSSTNGNDQVPHYIERMAKFTTSKWLNSQPTSSVLYTSMGSLFPISSAQMDEMVGGLKISGVQFLVRAVRLAPLLFLA
ncbi:hypothetical protein ACOSQ3_022154 [Xanthoceras sorbifolium]